MTARDPGGRCGEVFYGWLAPGTYYADFTVPRVCNLEAGHDGSHDRKEATDE